MLRKRRKQAPHFDTTIAKLAPALGDRTERREWIAAAGRDGGRRRGRRGERRGRYRCGGRDCEHRRWRSNRVDRVKRVDAAHLNLFYPLVYLVDLRNIAPARRLRAGSAKFGSREYRIDDLQEPEFELLFAHFREDKELHDIILDGHGRGGYVEVHTLYELLDRRARVNP